MFNKLKTLQKFLFNYQSRNISKGQQIPNAKVVIVSQKGKEFDKQDINTADYFKNKKIILVGYPGAFTPVCSSRHLPQYIERVSDVKSKKVDEILSLAVNDPWVVQAFAEKLGGSDKMNYIADGNGEFTKALQLTEDLSAKGLSIRSQRFAAIVDNGKIQDIFVESGKEESFVANVLKNL